MLSEEKRAFPEEATKKRKDSPRQLVLGRKREAFFGTHKKRKRSSKEKGVRTEEKG